MKSLNQAIIIGALEGLSLMHLSEIPKWEQEDLPFGANIRTLERDQLILTNRDVCAIATSIRYDRPTDNLIGDWELVTLEITIRAEAHNISRFEALDDLKSWAYEAYYYGDDIPDNYSYLAHI